MDNAEALLRYQSLEDNVSSLTKRVETLRTENQALKRATAKSEKDTHEFVAYFQREMEKKDDLLAQLNDKLTLAQNSLERERKEGKSTYEQKIEELKDKYERANKKLQMRLDVAEDELTVLSEFKSVKADLQQKLDTAREELEKEKKRNSEEINSIERKFIEEKARLKNELEAKVNDIKKRSREEAQRGLSADTRKLIADNKRMGEELRFQLQTSDELQRERNQLKKKCAQLKRECSLYAQKDEEYAKQGFKKEKLLRVANDTIKSLEKSLANMVHEFEAEQEKLLSKTKTTNEDLGLECASLRHLVKLKNRELRLLRGLSQEILDQRTEVEQFFIDALEQVKSERKIEMYEQNRESKSGGGFPQIRSKTAIPSDPQSRPQQQSNKVDLNDLSWDDKERVLRLLFAKINSMQTSVAVAPKQSTHQVQGKDGLTSKNQSAEQGNYSLLYDESNNSVLQSPTTESQIDYTQGPLSIRSELSQ